MKKSKKQAAVLSYEQEEKIDVPIVKSPSRIHDKRLGRGFSLKEIKAASIPIDEFSKLDLLIDYRRKSIYDSNVDFLGKKFRQRVSEELVEKEALDKIEKRVKEYIKDLSQIPSISKTNAKKIVDAGVTSIDRLIEEDSASLAHDIGEKVGIVNQWIKDAKKFKNIIALNETIKNLCQINILNEEKAKRLASIGITSVDILAEEDSVTLANELGISEYLANEWIKGANQLIKKETKKKKVEVQREAPLIKAPKKLKVQSKELNLRDIGGMGKIELNKLKDLEITSLEQFAEEDPDEISSIIGVNKEKVFTWINTARAFLGLPKIDQLIIKKKEPKVPKKERKEIEAEIIDLTELGEEIEEKPEEAEKIEEKKEVSEKKYIISKEDIKRILKELNKVKGIGKVTGEKLINAGIRSVKDLIEADPQELAANSGIKEEKIKQYINNATKSETKNEEPENED